jgi:hypothetical protein
MGRGLPCPPVAGAFYDDLGGGRFASTAYTAGPWSSDAQHGGPPAALLTRAMEHCGADANQRMARVTIDILRPVPVAPLDVRVRVVRPGRRITLLEAIAEAEGREVVQARGWRVGVAAAGSEPPAVGEERTLPALPAAPGSVAWDGAYAEGYLTAIEWRFAEGGFEQRGPAAAWMRSRIPLVGGEGTSPACRVMLVADSGSGVSAALDARRWSFVNVDLTVVLHRALDGEWVLLESATTVNPDGVGLATTTLSDQRGPIGRGLQTLVVSPR